MCECVLLHRLKNELCTRKERRKIEQRNGIFSLFVVRIHIHCFPMFSNWLSHDYCTRPLRILVFFSFCCWTIVAAFLHTFASRAHNLRSLSQIHLVCHPILQFSIFAFANQHFRLSCHEFNSISFSTLRSFHSTTFRAATHYFLFYHFSFPFPIQFIFSFRTKN